MEGVALLLFLLCQKISFFYSTPVNGKAWVNLRHNCRGKLFSGDALSVGFPLDILHQPVCYTKEQGLFFLSVSLQEFFFGRTTSFPSFLRQASASILGAAPPHGVWGHGVGAFNPTGRRARGVRFFGPL